MNLWLEVLSLLGAIGAQGLENIEDEYYKAVKDLYKFIILFLWCVNHQNELEMLKTQFESLSNEN